MINKRPVILLYGIDETSQQFEAISTLKLAHHACEALSAEGWRVTPLQIAHDLAPLGHFDPAEYVVLNLCEGSPHQTSYYASMATALERMGFVFTGSDAWSLEETQYKKRMKALLDMAGVPTPRWTQLEEGQTLKFDVFPAIIKPANEHCSYGITRDSVVRTKAEARRQCAKVIAEFKQPALIEEFLDSDEYNVSVWGSEAHPNGFEVLGISTMQYGYFKDVRDRLCTFDAKWTPESEAYKKIPAICPAPVEPAMQRAIERVAIDAYRASHCRDYGRVDIRLRGDLPMALDVNANCDVSDDGGFMNAARARGMRYGQMLERLVELALWRAEHASGGHAPAASETMERANTGYTTARQALAERVNAGREMQEAAA